MKNNGIKAVIIRVGYGRESSQKDSMFESHYKNAKSENMMIGVYWYSYADSVGDAEKEAKACLECINNKSLDMPIYYDLEDNSQTKLGKAKLTEIAELFCETIKKSGYNINDYKDGYAGDGSKIDAIKVYYTTPENVVNSIGKYLVAKYRVSEINKEYFDWQHDIQTSNGQEGYAGAYDCYIDRLQLILS